MSTGRNRNILGERICQTAWDIAQAIIIANDIRIRTIVCITKLAGGFAITAHAEADFQKWFIRSRFGRQVDNTATKFTRIIYRVAFLYNR